MTALERRLQNKTGEYRKSELNMLNRYRWLLGELHAGNEFSKDQLCQWLREAEMAHVLLASGK
jgi:hypothetical protein